MIKKVLVINTVGFQYEGTTSVILNYIGTMERDGLDFTFPVYEDTPQTLKERLDSLGRTVTVPDRKKDVRSYIPCLYRLLGEGYDVIHIHGNSGTMLIETVLAKLRGVKRILVHTHSTNTDHPIANVLMKYPMMYLADQRLACSRAAGDWLYGNHPYTILNNAIDISKFRFDPQKREQYRKEFGVKDEEFLIGHVGHFTQPKNHAFLLDIFNAYQKQNPESKLLLIGDGPDRQRMNERANELGIGNQVIFAGRRSDTASIYSAMDIFLLPSRWEGLPLVMLEAQVNGLPMLVSDVITKDAGCTDRVVYQPLADAPGIWADGIQRMKDKSFAREDDLSGFVRKNGFDIHEEAEKLRKIYIE